MDSNVNEAICNLRNISSIIQLKEEKGKIRILLDGEKVQVENMQEDYNAFEGVAIAAHICTKGHVILDIDQERKFKYNEYIGNGHLCRFLYRIMKFRKQYGKWFELSSYLQTEADKFEKYLKSGDFVNNIGSKDAGNKGKKDDENAVEEKLSATGVLKRVVKCIDIGNGEVHRQLPVGLFSEEAKEKNRVFIGRRAAIDLWVIKDDEINIVELKTKNVMIGIITEIFFYSNYVYDLVREDGLFQLSPIQNKKNNLRGYEEIANSTLRQINGIMLADDNNYHPWVCDESLAILNDNGNPNLKYFLENYSLDNIIGG